MRLVRFAGDEAVIGFDDDLNDLFMLGSVLREGTELATKRRFLERTAHGYVEAEVLSSKVDEVMSSPTGTVALTRAEVDLVAVLTRIMLKDLDVWEFETRAGFTPEEIQGLQVQILEIERIVQCPGQG